MCCKSSLAILYFSLAFIYSLISPTSCSVSSPVPNIFGMLSARNRARNVLEYVLDLEYVRGLSDDDRRTLEFWLTANGLSYGRSLDSNGEQTYLSHQPIDLARSRRVEFRIVTTGDEVLEEFVKANSK